MRQKFHDHILLMKKKDQVFTEIKVNYFPFSFEALPRLVVTFRNSASSRVAPARNSLCMVLSWLTV